ncbi:MAG: Arm DNA-binding domain-containing protein, partial [Myxococcota bacterium]
MKFTDKYILNLKPKATRYTVQEENAHGNGTLRLRVSPNGHKAWEFTYSFDGRVRRLTLGTYPAMGLGAAHTACGEAMRKRERGIDPGAVAVDARALERGAPTFNDLADRYLKEWAQPRKRSWKVDEAMLKRDVRPTWGPHKAEAIQRKDVRAL